MQPARATRKAPKRAEPPPSGRKKGSPCRSPPPALLSSILSYTLVAGMCPAAAFAEMTNEVQQPAIEEAVKTGDAATVEEAPAEDATEKQPKEDVIQPEELSSDAVETPSDETVANEGESTGDGTEAAAETVDGTEATTPTEGADPPPPKTKQATDSSERCNALDRKGCLRWATNLTGSSTTS